MIQEQNKTALRVYRAGFAIPCKADKIETVTVDAVLTSRIPDETSRFSTNGESDIDTEHNETADDTASYTWLAQHTPVNSNCLYSAVSFALTGIHSKAQ